MIIVLQVLVRLELDKLLFASNQGNDSIHLSQNQMIRRLWQLIPFALNLRQADHLGEEKVGHISSAVMFGSLEEQSHF